jgi:hypothetical protein
VLHAIHRWRKHVLAKRPYKLMLRIAKGNRSLRVFTAVWLTHIPSPSLVIRRCSQPQ